MKQILTSSSRTALDTAARSMYCELREAGYDRTDMIAFVSAFLSNVLAPGSIHETELEDTGACTATAANTVDERGYSTGSNSKVTVTR